MILVITPKTNIHTGGIDGEARFNMTGLIGSIRWWMEALVRGMGGYACSPTSENRCELDNQKFQQLLDTLGYHQAIGRMRKDICPVCQFFGCGGLSSAFKWSLDDRSLEVLEVDRGATIALMPLRPISPELYWLFANTLKIITQYGSIGGRNPAKKSSDGIAEIEIVDFQNSCSFSDVKNWLKSVGSNKRNNQNHPDLRNFWFIDDHFTKKQINDFLLLDSKGNPYNCKNYKLYEFLRGRLGVSKKIFSFQYKDYDAKIMKRTWGYVCDKDDFNKLNFGQYTNRVLRYNELNNMIERRQKK